MRRARRRSRTSAAWAIGSVRAAGIAPPIVCAALNFAAAFALLFVLAPATPLVADPVQRVVYVGTHLLEWRLGWLTWIAAALSLLWFYWWWRDRVGGSYVPLILGGLGLVADVTAELILVVGGVETYITTSPFAFALTGGVANGLYTLCGIGLTMATRLRAWERAWAVVMWAAGIALSVGALANVPVVTAGSTAILFALFCPWCVYLAVKLR
ncbi:MAG TPA: hypothetical protein VGS01_04790 [Candidatus Limnocylindria bacterium]|jgi:hypothetical protein|nr:hypothetical protein [Candidatus Limnocylindria bacterium]